MQDDITEVVRAGSRHRSPLVLARVLRNMTQRELERAAGIPDHQLAKYEGGFSVPNPATRARLAMALDVPVEVLFPDAAWTRRKR
jgi:transcriptional regulator with XRE-family HTH domain